MMESELPFSGTGLMMLKASILDQTIILKKSNRCTKNLKQSVLHQNRLKVEHGDPEVKISSKGMGIFLCLSIKLQCNSSGNIILT